MQYFKDDVLLQPLVLLTEVISLKKVGPDNVAYDGARLLKSDVSGLRIHI